MQGQLAALIVATSFAAGLNVPATTATLGLLAHAGLVTLPEPLQVLASWWAISASLTLFTIEFVADKIPGFDLVWNALQTFLRVPAAALLAYGSTLQLSPGMQIVATLSGGLIALVAHGGKTAARAAATTSPEPVSNIALSLGEDVAAIGITWLATRHPYWAAAISLSFLIVIFLFVRWLVAALRRLFARVY
jgi:hypothetical protein